MSGCDEHQALPLCLPDNCSWDEKTRIYQRDKDKPRRSLFTVPYTLSRLRAIPGPVCVVSIAGPCRKGKSFILSKVFDQGEVFPLGHLMDPETMGIWLWIVPERYKDSEGREFTLVLLDSEGTDAVQSGQVHDDSIFTLTVLLSSVLIYNSQGVPTRSDLEHLDHIGKLSQRIQVMSSQPSSMAMTSPNSVLPFFIWLLRDVVLNLPSGCGSFKEYLQQRVFTADNVNAGGAAQEILEFFSGFDAFKLPPPSCDPDVLSNMNEARIGSEISRAFAEGVQQFKATLTRRLEPKKGFHDNELVTGEALALLVEEYVKTLNQPDAVPCIENTWRLFVDQTCSTAASEAQQLYRSDMEKLFSGRLPCDDGKIRVKHLEILGESLQLFNSHVAWIAAVSTTMYLNTILNYTRSYVLCFQRQEGAEQIESEWLIRNNEATEMHCQDLLKALTLEILDPVLERVDGSEGAMVTFGEINEAYEIVEREFRMRTEGSRDLCDNHAEIFRMQAADEMQTHYQRLQLKKDYERSIEMERKAREQQQEEIGQLKNATQGLKESREEAEEKMNELKRKREEDMKTLTELLTKRMEAQKAEVQARVINNRAEMERQRADIASRRQNLESTIDELDRAMKERDREIANLRSQLR